MPFGSLFLHVSVCYLLTSYPDITLSTLGTRGFFSLATGSFVSSVAGRHVFGQRPKTRAAKRESLFKTSPKPETAHEKPLAPRVHFVLQYAEKWDRQIVCQTTPPPPPNISLLFFNHQISKLLLWCGLMNSNSSRMTTWDLRWKKEHTLMAHSKVKNTWK